MVSDFRDRVLGSIAAKLAVTLLALGGAVAAAVGIGYFVFSSVALSVTDLMERALPRIEASVEVMEATGRSRDRLAEIGEVTSIAELDAAWSALQTEFSALETGVGGLFPEEVALITPMLNDLRQKAEAKAYAVRARFEAETNLAARIDELETLAANARFELETLSNLAFSDLTRKSDEAVKTVRDTLSGLTDREFSEIRSILDLRTEVNLLASIAVAQATTAPGLSATLGDLSDASLSRLEEHLEKVARNASLAEDLVPVLAARDYIASTASRLRQPDRLLRLRQECDSALTEIIDTRSLLLSILAD